MRLGVKQDVLETHISLIEEEKREIQRLLDLIDLYERQIPDPEGYTDRIRLSLQKVRESVSRRKDFLTELGQKTDQIHHKAAVLLSGKKQGDLFA